MARIRSVKPEIFLHEDLAELPAIARLFFIGLWTQADREGRLEERPKRLKAALLPYDDVDITGLLDQLARGGFVRRYQAAGRPLLYIPSWKKHQHINLKEAKSTLPAPPDEPETTVPPPLGTPDGPTPSDADQVPVVPRETKREDTDASTYPARADTCAHGKARGEGKGEEGRGEEGRGRAQARETTPRRASLVRGPDPRIRRYGPVSVWQWQHDAFRARLGGGDVVALDQRLDAFYAATEARWGLTGEIPQGAEREVWQREFDRAFATPSARVVPGNRWVSGDTGHNGSRWERLCDALEGQGAINRHNRLQWLRPCVQDPRTSEHRLVVRVSPDAWPWISRHYHDALTSAFEAMEPGGTLSLVVDPSEAAEATA